MALRQAGGRRVVLTGIGMVTPLGTTREETWENIVGRQQRRRARSRSSRCATRRCASPARSRTSTRRSRMDRKLARRTDRYAQFVLVGGARGDRGRGLDVTADGPRRAHRHRGRDGHRRPADARRRRTSTSSRKGIDRMSPLWITMLIPNMGARDGLDGVRLPRPVEHASCTACAASSMAIGDARRDDPRRARRRDGRGRQRGADHADRRRRLLRDARDLAAQRRSRDGQPAVRRRARRLRDRRGLVDRRASRSSSTPARAAPASTARSWATAARPTRTTSPSPTRPASTRRAPCAWRSTRPACERERDRLHQRARHLDAASATPPRRA